MRDVGGKAKDGKGKFGKYGKGKGNKGKGECKHGKSNPNPSTSASRYLDGECGYCNKWSHKRAEQIFADIAQVTNQASALGKLQQILINPREHNRAARVRSISLNPMMMTLLESLCCLVGVVSVSLTQALTSMSADPLMHFMWRRYVET